ncbi:MAG: VWA domain-containing protein [Acidobacteria bacterium]|nr:VWA domain-containing protein [Acidobacteriota bacterium]
MKVTAPPPPPMMPARIAIRFVLLALPLWPQRVEVTNTTGGISIRVPAADRAQIRTRARSRPVIPGDVSIREQPGRVEIRCEPKDGAAVDLEVDLPYGVTFRAETNAGPIEVRGLIGGAELATGSGALTLAVPWRATRFQIEARQEPNTLLLPKDLKFTRLSTGRKQERRWLLSDRLDRLHVAYGAIRVTVGTPGRIELIDIPVPEDSPVKLPWQAPAILDALLAPPFRDSGGSPPQVRAAETVSGDAAATFRSDVRMAALSMSVTNARGAPIPGLRPEDFEVIEDGIQQQVRHVDAEQAPFNLALLMDLSGSTRRDRDAIRHAAQRFLGLARSQDKVALYALAADMFHVLSRLTAEHQRVIAALDRIPDVPGGSPIYDIMVLAYCEEFRRRPNERNALIVITDGVDNQIQGIGTPSEVSFRKLRQAAEGMNALIYPVFLDPFDKVPPPGWAKRARENMEGLAQASGGKLFPAHSIHDLEPVYAQVAQDLRSVYSVSYYPRNQEFNGLWRRVEVRAHRPGARVRTRPGYFAR